MLPTGLAGATSLSLRKCFPGPQTLTLIAAVLLGFYLCFRELRRLSDDLDATRNHVAALKAQAQAQSPIPPAQKGKAGEAKSDGGSSPLISQPAPANGKTPLSSLPAADMGVAAATVVISSAGDVDDSDDDEESLLKAFVMDHDAGFAGVRDPSLRMLLSGAWGGGLEPVFEVTEDPPPEKHATPSAPAPLAAPSAATTPSAAAAATPSAPAAAAHAATPSAPAAAAHAATPSAPAAAAHAAAPSAPAEQAEPAEPAEQAEQAEQAEPAESGSSAEQIAQSDDFAEPFADPSSMTIAELKAELGWRGCQIPAAAKKKDLKAMLLAERGTSTE
jgi:hypothetical protein